MSRRTVRKTRLMRHIVAEQHPKLVEGMFVKPPNWVSSADTERQWKRVTLHGKAQSKEPDSYCFIPRLFKVKVPIHCN